ncbi:MAG: hypothetical protein KIT18_14410 [Burkholderiales bacterium]|nr:hypothetical protein [Burkholderiales bacterium]
MIRVLLPAHLRTLARVDGEVLLEAGSVATMCGVLDTLEARYPMLRGTIRDPATRVRRPLIRFFACEQDWSHRSPHDTLPSAVIDGRQPLLIVGAIAGG